ncbi:MAG: hypothetical protein HKP30_14220, partial [Myxococcales bacterium]|nr:hypothetical protein [Myxococcales bacterium]
MNHADVKKKLADYLEGDLCLEERAVVDAHLDACAPCASEVEELEQTIRLLRGLPEPETPPMIAANVMRRIRAGETRPSFFERMRQGVFAVLEPSFVLPASAVAAAALVVVIVQDPGRFGLEGETGTRQGETSPAMAFEASTPIATPMTVMTAPRADERARAVGRPVARQRGFLLDASPAAERAPGLLAGAAPPAFVVGGTMTAPR